MDVLTKSLITTQRYCYISILTNQDGSFKRVLLATWNQNKIDNYITTYMCVTGEIPTLLISDCQRGNTITANIFLLTVYTEDITYQTATSYNNKFWLVNVAYSYAPNKYDVRVIHDPIRFKSIMNAERMYGPFIIESRSH